MANLEIDISQFSKVQQISKVQISNYLTHSEV